LRTESAYEQAGSAGPQAVLTTLRMRRVCVWSKLGIIVAGAAADLVNVAEVDQDR